MSTTTTTKTRRAIKSGNFVTHCPYGTSDATHIVLGWRFNEWKVLETFNYQPGDAPGDLPSRAREFANSVNCDTIITKVVK